jgi:hypothetical protein
MADLMVIDTRNSSMVRSAALENLAPWKVLGLFVALAVLIFWRSSFFYIMDDWTALIQMAEYPFGRYLLAPDGEQWFPLLHLIFYGLVKMAGEHYQVLVLLNCIGTGINAFLVYLFLRRHLGGGPALALGLIYTGAALHHAMAWNAFYIAYLLSLGFFLGALLLTEAYGRTPTRRKLWGLGILGLMSVLSHNYTLLALLALPLYLLLVTDLPRRRVWAVAGVVGVIYLLFAGGYLLFAGRHAAASHNLKIFSGLPGPAYLAHMICGALLSPFFYLFWGHYHFPIYAYVAGVGLLGCCLLAIWRWGGSRERSLAVWAVAANCLPFLLVSLTRYQRSVNQAFVARYGIFTLIGALLLIGLAWNLLAARIPQPRRTYVPALLLAALVIAGQALSLPIWQAKYAKMSESARACYLELTASPTDREPDAAEFARFCPTAYPVITRSQALAIRRFLNGAG